MKNNDLLILLDNAKKIIIEVGDFIKKEQAKVLDITIETKSLNSLVSYVDKTAEKRLVAGLKPLLSNAAFITEEETIEREQADYQWIIDPLDGTTNFLHGLPIYSVSVALRHKKEFILGVVYEPNRQECFYATRGNGAFLNGKKISVSNTEKLADSLLATGFPYFDFEQMPKYINVLTECMQKTRGVRRWGSAAVDLAYVAAGRFDAFFEYNLNTWDVAAGAFIVQEAGGKVVDFSGKDELYWSGAEIIAGNGRIEQDVLEIILRHFSEKS